VAYTIQAMAGRVADFARRQKRNYRVAVARSSVNSFFASLTGQYSAIYTVGLGADSVQLGSLSSVGSAISTLISIPVGWLVDRYGMRLFFLLSIVLSAVGVLFYALAHDWRILVGAAIIASASMRLTSTGCSVLCADSVENRDRVTAQNVCGTLGAIAAMASPLVGAYLVTAFGGMNVEGIRPLYYVQFVGYGLVFLLVATQLREAERKRLTGAKSRFGFVADFRDLFQRGRHLGRWIAITALTQMPMAMF